MSNPSGLTDLDEILNDPDYGRNREVTGYRGVWLEDAVKIIKQKKLLPSQDLMPLDWEVVEYSIGDEISEMSEQDIDDWVADVCWWYDGSRKSIKGGLNLTSDFDNARGYAGENGVVFGIQCTGDFAEFSDAHLFAKSAKECKIVSAYYQGETMSVIQLAKIFKSFKKDKS